MIACSICDLPLYHRAHVWIGWCPFCIECGYRMGVIEASASHRFGFRMLLA